MLELVANSTTLWEAWRQAHDEWGPGQHEDGFGLGPSDAVETLTGFATWVERLNSAPRSGEPRSICRWIVEDGQVLGGIALRLDDNSVTDQMGHVGFGITPSARGQGVAKWALNEVCRLARVSGMERVLLVCEASNVASAKTIESCGGVLDTSTAAVKATSLRYWIEL